MNQPMRTVDPTWTWGSSAELVLKSTGLVGGGIVSASQQLAQVSLPEPAVCSLYFQAAARITNPQNLSVAVFTVNLNQGLGRVTVPRQLSFSGQPADGAPLEYTLPFIPLHALNVDVSCTANANDEAPGEIAIQIYLVIAPITRIPQKTQKMEFGMATPGEADSLDDELRENLEEEAPTVEQIMGREADERAHGEQPETAPAWMLDLVDRLTARLRRAPTRQELRAAIARHQARAARRVR